MKIQTICTSLLLSCTLNITAYAANKTDYLQLKSVETKVKVDATNKKRIQL